MQYDCSAWEYSQQSWEAPGPKVGAELLTELRLAELKRLIDRDAKALKASSEVMEDDSWKDNHYDDGQALESLENEIDSADSADCTTRAPDSNEDTPVKEEPEKAPVSPVPYQENGDADSQAGDRPAVAEPAAAPSRRAKSSGGLGSSRAAKSASAESKESKAAAELQKPAEAQAPTPAEHKAAVSSKGRASEATLNEAGSVADTSLPPPEAEESDDADEVAAAPARAPAPPGLEARSEKCLVATANFTPESRTFGEMPVRMGDEIFVSGDPLDGWIFGMKRGSEPDEGWLPASALDIEDEMEEEERREAELPRARPSGGSNGGRRGGRGRGSGGSVTFSHNPISNAGGAYGGSIGRKGAAFQQRGPMPQHRKGGGNRLSEQHHHHYQQQPQEPWHHHGNWWSKQRHLKPEKGEKDVYSAASKTPVQPAASSDEWRRPAAAAAAEAVERQPQSRNSNGRSRGGRRGGAGGGGRGGRGGGDARVPSPEPAPNPRMERAPRARPALKFMLDRLNEPLVAPK